MRICIMCHSGVWRTFAEAALTSNRSRKLGVPCSPAFSPCVRGVGKLGPWLEPWFPGFDAKYHRKQGKTAIFMLFSCFIAPTSYNTSYRPKRHLYGQSFYYEKGHLYGFMPKNSVFHDKSSFLWYKTAIYAINQWFIVETYDTYI